MCSRKDHNQGYISHYFNLIMCIQLDLKSYLNIQQTCKMLLQLGETTRQTKCFGMYWETTQREMTARWSCSTGKCQIGILLMKSEPQQWNILTVGYFSFDLIT